MNTSHVLVGLSAFVLATAAPTFAEQTQKAGHEAPPMVTTTDNSRFGGPGVYTGSPALGVTLAVVEAGGGPTGYKTTTLLQTLAGTAFNPEVAKLTKTYGADGVAQFLRTFDFIMADALQYVSANHIALPAQPAVDPKNGEALAGALWGASSIGEGKHNVEVGLDHLVGHALHLQIMNDVDKKYGTAADAQYHVILTAAMSDLAAAYHLDEGGKMTSGDKM